MRRMLVGAALAAVAIPGGSALADRDDVRTHLTLEMEREVTHDTFFGRVKSVETACRRNRRLKLLFLGADGNKETVAKLMSDRKGHWRRQVNDEDDHANPGQWQIVARQARVETGEGTITCMRGESDRIPIN